MSSVRLSVTLMYHDHIGWKSWKLIARAISPTSSLFIAERSPTYSQGNMEKFWGENVRSTPTSITSGWIKSTESRVILGGGVAACLLLWTHRAVIFAISQLSCMRRSRCNVRSCGGWRRVCRLHTGIDWRALTVFEHRAALMIVIRDTRHYCGRRVDCLTELTS